MGAWQCGVLWMTKSDALAAGSPMAGSFLQLSNIGSIRCEAAQGHSRALLRPIVRPLLRRRCRFEVALVACCRPCVRARHTAHADTPRTSRGTDAAVYDAITHSSDPNFEPGARSLPRVSAIKREPHFTLSATEVIELELVPATSARWVKCI